MEPRALNHLDAQVSYFEKTSYQERFDWQTQDPFVVAHEQETLQTLIQALLEGIRTHGSLKVLESGCGEGANLSLLRKNEILKTQVHFYGIDPCLPAVDFALRQQVGEIVQGNGLKLPWPDEYFDLSFCRDVLHHLENADQQKTFLQELQRVTKKSGTIIAIEPNANNPCILLQSFLLPAEKFVRHTKERDVTSLLSHTNVTRTSPSALWRMLWHYKLPLSLRKRLNTPIRVCTSFWEGIARHSPSLLWSYRVYRWKKEGIGD